MANLYNMRISLTIIIICAFLATFWGPLPSAQASDLILPAPGTIVHLSPTFQPAMLKGIKVHPKNPFKFEFILDKGDGYADDLALKLQSIKFIKYFLASLTVPERDLWVNLSPYEKDRVVPEAFGQTEMGRDLLAQDYMLKQITASLIYPEDETGKKFWKRIYEEAAKKFGTTNIPVNTFNKVWIVPEKAVVYENAQAGIAYVVESKLKVMLEEDYLALNKNTIAAKEGTQEVSALGSQIVREVVIPQLTREVNSGKHFIQLRQVYNSLILATWYKKKIKDSILSQVYADKNKITGVKNSDPQEKQKIYQRYLQAFKKGVYNYIKEEIDPATQQPIPRKYFSGGVSMEGRYSISIKVAIVDDGTASPAMKAQIANEDQASLAKISANLSAVGQKIQDMAQLPGVLPDNHPAVKPDGFQIAQHFDPVLFAQKAYPVILARTVGSRPQNIYSREKYLGAGLNFIRGILPDSQHDLTKEFSIEAKKGMIDYKGNGEYEFFPSGESNTEDKRFDLRYTDTNIGWKFHLNVKPENVDKVSRFLIIEGVKHKFLHGGTTSDGKIYTVYIGSFSLARKMAKFIRDNIGQYLETPLASEEIEFEKGIVGRFNGFMGIRNPNGSYPDNPFLQYGDIGINFLRSEIVSLPKNKGWGIYLRDNPKAAEHVWEKSFQALIEWYGDYFMDGSWLSDNQDELQSTADRAMNAWVKSAVVAIGLALPVGLGAYYVTTSIQGIFDAAMKSMVDLSLSSHPDLIESNLLNVGSAKPLGYLSTNYIGAVVLPQIKQWAVKKGLEWREYAFRLPPQESEINFDILRRDLKDNRPMSQRFRNFLNQTEEQVDGLSDHDLWEKMVIFLNIPDLYKWAPENLLEPLLGEKVQKWVKEYNPANVRKGRDLNAELFKAIYPEAIAEGKEHKDLYIFEPKVLQHLLDEGDQKGMLGRGIPNTASEFVDYIMGGTISQHGVYEESYKILAIAFADERYKDHPLYQDMIRQANAAMNAKSRDLGGIDFNSDKMNLQLQNAGQEIKFHVDAAMLQQLQSVPGFTPIIINIQPMTNLRVWLGLNDQKSSHQIVNL